MTTISTMIQTSEIFIDLGRPEINTFGFLFDENYREVPSFLLPSFLVFLAIVVTIFLLCRDPSSKIEIRTKRRDNLIVFLGGLGFITLASLLLGMLLTASVSTVYDKEWEQKITSANESINKIAEEKYGVKFEEENLVYKYIKLDQKTPKVWEDITIIGPDGLKAKSSVEIPVTRDDVIIYVNNKEIEKVSSN